MSVRPERREAIISISFAAPRLETSAPRYDDATSSTPCASSITTASKGGITPARVAARRQMCEEQVVIGDQNLRFLGFAARFPEKRLVVEIARAPHAQVPTLG